MGIRFGAHRAVHALVAVALVVTAVGWGLIGADPADAAVPHPTQTKLHCPTTVSYGADATCTVIVDDVLPKFLGSKKTPTGTASVATILGRLDVDGSPCTLVAVDGSSSSCTVTVTPTDTGVIAPGASYNPTGNFVLSVAGDLLTATSAPLTVSADPQTITYGDPVPALTVSYSGFVLGDGPDDLTGTLSCTTTATDTSPAGDYPITCDGLSSSHYDIAWQAGTLTIDPAPLTVTADSESRTYGAVNPALGASYAGFVDGEGPGDLTGTLTCATTATTQSPVGNYAVACEGLSSPNYAIDWVEGSLAVTPAELTITADDASRVTGQANPAFTVGYSGLVASDTPADLAGTLTCTSPATADSPVGQYAISCGGLSSSDYDISWVSGHLDVLAAPAAVIADGSDLTPGGDLEVDSDGWKPASVVTVSVCGVEVGTATADADGVVSTKVSLPSDLPVGQCDVVLSGTDAADSPYAVVLGITLTRAAVPPPPPGSSPTPAPPSRP